jgi:hypothetical protein
VLVLFELLIMPAFRPADSIMLENAKPTALAIWVRDFFAVIDSLRFRKTKNDKNCTSATRGGFPIQVQDPCLPRGSRP